jgi:hypothetical protein
MIRKAHMLKHNRTTELPRHLICVDTETRSDANDEQHLMLFVSKYVRTDNDHIEKEIGTTADAFWDFVESKSLPKTRLVLSAHNWSFDFIVLDSIRQLKRRGWTMQLPIFDGVKFIGKARRGDQSLAFIDTMNYAPVSLAELGQSLGIEKLEMPDTDTVNDDLVTYCERDCDILVAFWRYLIDFVRSNNLGVFATTVGSMAFNAYRHRFMRTKIYIHDNERVTALERDGYYGGRCEIFYQGQKQGHYVLLDVNSLYPYVMRDNTYPHRLLGHRKNISVDGVIDLMRKGYYLIARVALDTNTNAFPYRYKSKLVFPQGRFVTTLHHAELVYALQNGLVRAVRECSFYDQSNLFKDYADFFHDLKNRYSENGQSAFRLFAKLMLNSLYGKFGQMGHRTIEIKHNLPMTWGVADYLDVNGKLSNIVIWDGRGYLLKREGESYNAFTAIAGAVTAYGRMKLWQLMRQAGLEHVFYCDTDSLIVDEIGFLNLVDEIDNHTLGKLKIESQSDMIEIRGAKDYVFGEREHIKGVSLKAEKLGSGHYRQLHFATFRETLKSNRLATVKLSYTEKHLRRIYEKGVVGDDGRVSPLILSEF